MDLIDRDRVLPIRKLQNWEVSINRNTTVPIITTTFLHISSQDITCHPLIFDNGGLEMRPPHELHWIAQTRDGEQGPYTPEPFTCIRSGAARRR
jgi:hypothetical protein